MVSVRPIPPSWLAALRPGGRLVVTIAGTSLLLTASKTDDGGAMGRIEFERCGFMTTRSADDYPANANGLIEAVRDAVGDQVSQSRDPIPHLAESWDLKSMFALAAPDVDIREEQDNGRRTMTLTHPDGSWARATAVGTDTPEVHQGGPRRLWGILDEIRDRWNVDGYVPVYGCPATVDPDGTIHLRRPGWTTVVR
jgi:hypothetical protein